MAPRVSPTKTICAQIHNLFAGDGDLMGAIEHVARLSVRLRFQSVAEEIVSSKSPAGSATSTRARTARRLPQRLPAAAHHRPPSGRWTSVARSCARPTPHCTTSSSDRA